jgi:hypothetical protein
VTPLRAEVISLLCEDTGKGRSQALLNKAIWHLREELPFASEVQPVGVASKSDVQVRTKFARAEKLRVFALRDRDFLMRPLLAESRERAFDKDPQRVRPWPLPRHSIESYLLDEDVLHAAAPSIPPKLLQEALDEAVAARLWLDVARGTLDDLAYRARGIRQQEIRERPTDRASCLDTVLRAAGQMRDDLATSSSHHPLVAQLDALAGDMAADGPLRHRVDGRELVRDLERALTAKHPAEMPPGGLFAALDRHARLRPPAALIADVRAALELVPPHWRPAA